MSQVLLSDTIAEAGKHIQARMRLAYDRLAVKRDAVSRLEALRAVRIGLVEQVDVNDQAKVVLHAIEQAQHVQLKAKVEGLVSFALKTIFERDLRFEVDFDSRGQQTEAHFYVRDERGLAMSIRNAHGGGLMVVSAFVLQVVVMMSIRPALRPLLVVDEPFGHVSEQYRDKLVEFVRNLAESSGIQFIVVTHLADLAQIGDKRYALRLVDGVTTATPA